jgi:5,10-methylenetetrahydromethanopterin reductase
VLGLVGRLPDGIVTWMTEPRTLEAHIGARIRKAAADAGRPEPRVVAGYPIAVTDAPDLAREVAGDVFAIYGTLPSYRAVLEREGVAGPGDNALVGDAAALEAELRRLVAVGVIGLPTVPKSGVSRRRISSCMAVGGRKPRSKPWPRPSMSTCCGASHSRRPRLLWRRCGR